MEHSLERLGDVFSAGLTQIRAQHGAAWTVFHNGQVLRAFPTFGEAADFAFQALGEADYLIRHTYQEPEFAPFLLVKEA